MEYVELNIRSAVPHAYEILTAELAAIGFDSFMEEDGSLKAYIPSEVFSEIESNHLLAQYAEAFELDYDYNIIPSQNWNAIWESEFQPVTIDNELIVRAPFHKPDPIYRLEIIVQPKMSFGTGHHATTWLVMKIMLGMDLWGTKVLDFGTGTGILAVLAEKLGAAEVYAVDNDIQCMENAEETFSVNNNTRIHLRKGDIQAFAGNKYDAIIGNITRNTILDYLKGISESLNDNGRFIASGFYMTDLSVIKDEASAFGLSLLGEHEKENWCAALFEKKT